MGEEKPFERIPPIRPGDEVLRRWRKPRRRLRLVPNVPGIFRFIKDIATQTPFLPIISVLVVLWLLFSTGLYFAERGVNESLNSFGDVLLWSLTAIQTMGSPHMPVTSSGRVIQGVWIVLGTMVFWGAIIASVTTYFMLPRRRPTRQIINTIEYNLEIFEDLSADELETLKETTVRLIETRIDQLKRGSS